MYPCFTPNKAVSRILFRNCMWRFGYLNPINYNDNEVFCGGVAKQFEVSIKERYVGMPGLKQQKPQRDYGLR